MKKQRVISSLLALSLAGVTLAQDIGVVIDGEKVPFPSQSPVIQNQRILVPLRGVFEEMGATVSWDPHNRSVTAIKGSDRIYLEIASTGAKVNEVGHQLDVAPQIRNGHTLIPLRFVSEALKAQVSWQSEEKRVLVASEGGDNLQPDTDKNSQSFTGFIRPSQPSIYMQGSHRLEDSSGKLIVLLTGNRDLLERYLGKKVTVTGKAQETVEGNQTILTVEEVSGF